jgi:hypothetical protein
MRVPRAPIARDGHIDALQVHALRVRMSRTDLAHMARTTAAREGKSAVGMEQQAAGYPRGLWLARAARDGQTVDLRARSDDSHQRYE